MRLALLSTWISTALAMDILVPAYFYPEGKGLSYWNNLTATAQSGQVPLTIIINPEDGPGSSLDTTYATVNTNVRNAGAKTIGYLHSSYGARPYADFVTDVNRYVSWYPVDGFFIDEMSDDGNTTIVNYYLSLYNYIKSVNSKYVVINNPGTTIPQVFLTTRIADRFVIFESRQKAYSSYTQPAWQSSYSANNFIHIVYNSTQAQMSSDVTFANGKGIGGIYITDDKGNNPYDTLPTYWNQEVAAVQTINASG